MSDVLKKRIEKKRERRKKVHWRIRKKVFGTSERPRLCVYKSLRYIYAQIVDDERGFTLVAASTLEPELRNKVQGSNKSIAAATLVGETIGKRALAKGIKKVVFDRSGYIYHGRVKAVAEGARKAGLQF